MASHSKVEKFDELNLYKKARLLTKAIYNATRGTAFSKDYGLTDQIRRASITIMSNIAEGFERGSNKEFIQFLFIAKGSCGEVRAQLSVALDQNYIDDELYNNLIDESIEVSKMLSKLISYLKDSPYKGAKHKRN